MAKKTLAQLSAEADERYGNYELELENSTLVLLPVLRLSDAKQDTIRELQRKMTALESGTGNTGGDETEKAIGSSKRLKQLVHEFIRTAAATRKPADELIKLKGDDLGFLMTLIEDFMKDSQLGEVSASES